jgi:hypothetical protein
MCQGALDLSVMEAGEGKKKQLEPIWREKKGKILEDPRTAREDRRRNLHDKLFSFVAVGVIPRRALFSCAKEYVYSIYVD